MTVLLQWLWQGTVLALAVAIALRCMPRLNATTRYVVWWLVLAATLLLPYAGALASATQALVTSFGALDGEFPGMAARALPDDASPWLAIPAMPDWLLACGAGVWLGSVILGCSRLAASVMFVHRLKRDSQPLPASVAATLRTAPEDVRGAELRCSPAIDGACAAGLTGRPAIVISHRLLGALDPDALDLIVLHELTHLRRYDDWWRALQTCVVILAGLHPAIRFISSRIDAEREAACDEAVAALSGQPRRYAASLAAVADLLAGAGARRRHALAPNAMGSGSLVERVQRLLDPRGCRDASLHAGVLLAATAVVTLATTGFGRLHPLVEVAGVQMPPVGRNIPAPPLDGRVIAHGGTIVLAPAAPPFGPVSAQPTRRRPAPRAATVSRPADESTSLPASAVPERNIATGLSGNQPGSAVTDASIATAAADRGPLPATPLLAANTVVVAIRGNNVRNRESSGDNGWASTGASAGRVGAAIGGYFNRAGKAVASHF